MKRKNICFVTINCNPEYLGGYALYHKNLIRYIKKNNKDIRVSWAYFGDKNRRYLKEGVEYFEIKTDKLRSFLLLGKNFSLARFFKKNKFEIINSIGGPWTFFYKKKKGQRIIQTFHGTVYYFYKNHLQRLNPLMRALFSPFLLVNWLQERPHKKTDKFICVSEKVKEQVKKLYSPKEDKLKVIRTGVDISEFKKNKRERVISELKLDGKKIYGLYVGGGGFWTKGLDRTINLSREIYKKEKNFRLIVIGPDFLKVKKLIGEDFVIFLKNVPREKMSSYYSVSDMFFCMSRYEGGAPTLVVSEAMASECLLICSKDSRQEIIKDAENGIIISSFGEQSARKIISLLENKKRLNKIKKEALKTVNKLSLENWGKETVKELIS